MCDEGSFPLIAILDVNIVVSPLNVKLGKMMSVFQLVYKIGDEGKGVCVISSMFAEVSIVLTRVEFAILLFDKEEG